MPNLSARRSTLLPVQFAPAYASKLCKEKILGCFVRCIRRLRALLDQRTICRLHFYSLEAPVKAGVFYVCYGKFPRRAELAHSTRVHLLIDAAGSNRSLRTKISLHRKMLFACHRCGLLPSLGYASMKKRNRIQDLSFGEVGHEYASKT